MVGGKLNDNNSKYFRNKEKTYSQGASKLLS